MTSVIWNADPAPAILRRSFPKEIPCKRALFLLVSACGSGDCCGVLEFFRAYGDFLGSPELDGDPVGLLFRNSLYLLSITV